MMPDARRAKADGFANLHAANLDENINLVSEIECQ